MKLRLIPIAITAAVSAALLFGGWYAYGKYGVEQPLDKAASLIPGVESAQTSRQVSGVEVKLKLKPDADLAEIYRRVQEESAGSPGGAVKLTVDEPSDPKLEKAWSYAMFDVAEAMAHRQYSGIRDAMTALMQQYPDIQADTQMDDTNVYVRLRSGDAVKFVILPREGEKLEVWPNA